MKIMFCPKCGASEQCAESYCKRCGEWLPDVEALAQPRLFRKLSRDEKIVKMRVLEMVSAGLALTSVAVIATVLSGGNDKQILFLALICCLLVAIYQMVNLYLGHKVQRKERNRGNDIDASQLNERKVEALGAADTKQFMGRASVVENATELLEPISRATKKRE